MSLETILKREAEVAQTLDRLIIQAERDATVLDPRMPAEMHLQLATEHPAIRLRYIAYRMRRAREALL